MKRLNTLLVVALFVMAGCGGEKQTAGDLVTVDVIKSYPKKELILQDFMDVEYIPLETSDEFITMAHIEAVSDDLLIIRNRNRSTDGQIFIYDRKGKGLRIINRLGESAEEYLFLLGITLDEENNELFVNDHYTRKIYVYDLYGKYKRSFEFKEGASYSNNIYNFDRNHLICCDGSLNFEGTIKNKFLILSKQDGTVFKEIEIPFNKYLTSAILHEEAGMVMPIRNEELVPSRDGWVVMEPSSDTIYHYSSEYEMTPLITRIPAIQSMDTKIFLYPNVITDRYCFMQTVKKEYNFGTRDGHQRVNLMYDKKAGSIYEYTVYNGDYSKKRTVDLAHEVAYVNKGEIAFIKKLEAHLLVESYEKGELKGKLKELAATLDEESNPVIMLAKYKN